MKHSKFLNSAIIDNLFKKVLIAEATKNIASNKVDGYAKILAKFPLIRKELKVFNQLAESYTTEDRRIAQKLITELRKDIKNKEWSGLEVSRQKFFEEVKKIAPEIVEASKEKIRNYKFYASIKNFIDDSIRPSLSPKDRVMVEETIIKTITEGTHISRNFLMANEASKIPAEVDVLVTEVLIDNFSKKWKNALTESQYKYLIDYAANGDDNNYKWLNSIRKRIRKIDEGKIADETVREMFVDAKKNVEESINLNAEQILEYNELIDELSGAINNEQE